MILSSSLSPLSALAYVTVNVNFGWGRPVLPYFYYPVTYVSMPRLRSFASIPFVNTFALQNQIRLNEQAMAIGEAKREEYLESKNSPSVATSTVPVITPPVKNPSFPEIHEENKTEL